MLAEIIAAGSEMLTPFRQDTNSLFLTAGLNELGIEVAFKTIVGDNLQHLTDAARVALRRADVVFFSGGLGPTEDDLTREAVAGALGIALHRDEEQMQSLRERFAKRGIPMPEINHKQADILDGAEVLRNANGSAPGQFLRTALDGRERLVFLLPGPPKELKPLFDDLCRPRLLEAVPERHMARRQIRIALLPESQVDARTAPLYKQFADIETTILAQLGEIQLHLQCVKPTLAEAEMRLAELTALINHEMGAAAYSDDGKSLEEVVLLRLTAAHQTLSTAESCTGGMLAERLTALAGSSQAYLGGVVSYHQNLKTLFADVPAATIQEHGTVSPEVARELARGIRQRTGADLGISVTGIAGPAAPGGADAGRPVGLVYLGLAHRDAVEVKELHLQGDRDRIRYWATQHALDWVRLHLA